ncbi:hypothetical protein [Paenibacillus bovis]|uniref:Uncharacterized protein n=1 Tax=Paenibacillus bovis TaxID=1616788 RepID=A0A1X9T445_9BACL|nr:hypothetical protein [Paenibacillus bovis]ARR10664.1 hypothetical protein AR543_p0056 [Paenibacillus bovis]
MSTLIKGDQVVMTGCGEAEEPENQGVVWTCEGDSYRGGSQERVFLEGYGPSFMVSCLRKATPEEIEKYAARPKESAPASLVYQSVICGIPGATWETPEEALADIVEHLATAADLPFNPEDIHKIIQLHMAALILPPFKTADYPVTLNLFSTAYQLIILQSCAAQTGK